MHKILHSARSPLLWLTVLYLIAGLTYVLIPPMFEKPDEDGHYGYVRYLEEQPVGNRLVFPYAP